MKTPRHITTRVGLALGVSLSLLAGCGDSGSQTSKTKAPDRTLEIELPSALAEDTPTPTSGMVAPPIEATPVVPVAEPEPPKTFRELIRDGKRLSKKKKHLEALEVLEAALENKPGSATAHIELARAHIGANQPKKARDHAELALEIVPDSSYAWNTMGRVELQEGKREAAVTSFQRATDENEDNTYAWNNLGLTLSLLERWEEAAEALEMATSGDKPSAYMWNNLGLAYEKLDRLVEARAAYRQAASAGSDKAKSSLKRLEEVTFIAEEEDDAGC